MTVAREMPGADWISEQSLARDMLIMLAPPIRTLAGDKVGLGALGSCGLSGGEKKDCMLVRHCVASENKILPRRAKHF